MEDSTFFGTQKISTILWKIAPPVMLAQLIMAMYNIVDSFFIGMYSEEALTALTVVFPLQLLIIALAVGTGVGVNTYMARQYALGKDKDADHTSGAGLVLILITWAIFAVVSALIMEPYVRTSATDENAIRHAVTYGNIVCIGSIGCFLEGLWSKVHQSRGNMKLPMVAQITGALTNVVLDPILIFGFGPIKPMGVAGAAFATVAGQIVSAIIVGIKGANKPPCFKELAFYRKRIYFYGYSNIVMQTLYTVYIVGLNMVLAQFSDSAVTVLGLYYKLQTFFFLPLIGLETCIVPLISYNHARKDYLRCRRTFDLSMLISGAFMIVGIVVFIFFNQPLIGIFSKSEEVLAIGKVAFPIICSSFICAVPSLLSPVFFQAIGKGFTSMSLAILRQIVFLLPIFYLLSFFGLNYTWLAFPISETLTGAIGMFLYGKELKKWGLNFFTFLFREKER